jgi:glycosyltransferase involved in cell wall biosynthesis
VCTATEEELGLRPGSVTLLYNGVPSASGSSGGPPRGGTPTERFAIGAVGRLVPEKGFDVLIRALAGLPEADLVLMVDGPERAGLEGLGRELGLQDRMTFTGWVEPPWVARQRCDVLVMPSRVGGLSEVVEDGVTGLLVPSDDPEALASALRELEGDSVLRAELAERGRADVRRRFSVEAMMSAYDRFLAS